MCVCVTVACSENVLDVFRVRMCHCVFTVMLFVRVCFLLSRFADKPKKGVRFLQEKRLVGVTAEDVAKFFFSDERLDKVCFPCRSV